jgi:hypothetical protein
MVATRSYGASLVAVLVLAAGCGGTRHTAVQVEASASSPTSSTETTTTLPGTNVSPARLTKALTLDNGIWYLAPPRPADTTSLTDAIAGDNVSHNADGSPAKPIVFLARVTDEIPTITHAAPGSYVPTLNDKLVVVVLEYGPNPVALGGATGATGPPPTGLSSYESMLGFVDAVTGEGSGFGASYPGPPPPISTSPPTG